MTQPKLRVDDTHSLDLARLRRDGFLKVAPGTTIPWIATWSVGPIVQLRVACALVRTESIFALGIWLHTTTNTNRNCTTGVSNSTLMELVNSTPTEIVELTPTRPHLGGIRWWFVCPLVVDGRPCSRRARILYLPTGARYFGCRTCYSLSYQSRQEHRLRLYEHITWPLRLLTEWEEVKRGRSKRRRLVLMARLNPEVRAAGRNFNRRLREVRGRRARSDG